jgi:DNA-binding MurR/RpiR family transcriptional regulator
VVTTKRNLLYSTAKGELPMFRERIQNHYETLSPRFRSLADFVLENTLDVGFMTATELARRVGVDPATVVRFSQELGYSGYRELSREIKNYINNQLALRYGRREPELEGIAGEVSLLIDEISTRILDMKVEAARIGDIVQTLSRAHRVIITGTAASANLAELWATHLRLIGLEADYVPPDPARVGLCLRDLDAEDIIVAVAVGLTSGSELGYVLGTAAELGISTVSITASPTLLPAREASTNLVVPSRTPSGYPSFDAVAVVLSVIWQALISQNEVDTGDSVAQAMDKLIQLLSQRDRVPPYDNAALQRLWQQK